MDLAVSELRNLGDFGLPDTGEGVAVGFLPMGLRHHCQRYGGMFHRADEADPAFDFAVVEYQTSGRDLHGGAARLAVDQENRAGIGQTLQRLIECDRMVALALGDREQPGLCGRAGMSVDRPPAGHDEALGRQRLQANIISAGRDCALDPRGQQLLERGKQNVLEIDGQRQQDVGLAQDQLVEGNIAGGTEFDFLNGACHVGFSATGGRKTSSRPPTRHRRSGSPLTL